MSEGNEITVEQFQEWSNSDAGREALRALVPDLAKESGYIPKSDLEGLESNKDQILREKKEIEELQKKAFDLLGVKSKLELEAQIAKRENPGVSEEKLGLIQLEATKTRLEGDLEASNGKVANANQKILELSAKAEIKTSLITEGMNEAQAELYSKALMQEADFTINEDYSVLSKDGLSPKDWLVRWKESDYGKNALPAKNNSGGEFKNGETSTGGAGKANLIKQRDELNAKPSKTPQEMAQIAMLNRKIRQSE
ncbi:MAG: hypothetical protein GWN64_16835 [Candidatus Thorarchaeota archaeon]|nr:hypothetical protein [Candidatus Thorarchaeota archaeon]